MEGKTIVITGAARGLGRAWTMGFLKEGAKVVAADMLTDELTDLAGQGALTITADVSLDKDVRAMIDFAVEQTGRIDVLFNNAGYGLLYAVDEFPEDSFEKLVAVHLFGSLYGMRAAIPIMREQGYGRIINTVSRVAEFAGPKGSAYAAAKAGLWSLSKSAAAENKDHDILINMLIPGPTNTSIWGRDMPKMQSPEVTFPTARMLASLPKDGPSGKVFWDEKEYQLFKVIYD
ncbi:MAG: SDR family oxidoreductase [Proteobacteria bacterium]|nr:SDR family oxidoreductase [Pseudomonadota bacterium]